MWKLYKDRLEWHFNENHRYFLSECDDNSLLCQQCANSHLAVWPCPSLDTFSAVVQQRICSPQETFRRISQTLCNRTHEDSPQTSVLKVGESESHSQMGIVWSFVFFMALHVGFFIFLWLYVQDHMINVSNPGWPLDGPWSWFNVMWTPFGCMLMWVQIQPISQ